MEYCVIGLGGFGVAVAKELQKNGNDVVCVDIDPVKCREISSDVSYTMILDATDEKALLEASLHHIDVIIVCMGELNITNSVLTCLNLQNIGIKRIIAKATSDQQEKILRKIGIEEVIRPEMDMGIRTARKLERKSVIDYLELSDDVTVEGYKVQDGLERYIGKSIYEINLRKKYNVNIVCIKRGKELIIPESDTLVLETDLLILVGQDENLATFEKKLGKEK